MSREDLRGRGIRPYDEKVHVDAQIGSGLTMNLLWLRVLHGSKEGLKYHLRLVGTIRSMWGLERHHGKPAAP